MRIPGWCRKATLAVNGKVMPEPVAGKYYEINRSWKKGDTVELVLAMDPQLMTANPLVEETRNQVAVQRGPVVYCLESKDLPDGVKTSEVMIPHNIDLKPRYDKSLLGGITILEGKANILPENDWSNTLYKPQKYTDMKEIKIKLIPYYVWNNRGVSSMTVWMPLTIMQ